MKILHILVDTYIGGAQKFCIDICNTQANMVDTENEIFLLVLNRFTDEQPMFKRISSKVNVISLNKEGGYSLKIIYKIYQLLSEIKPNIIHLNGRALIYASIPILVQKIPSVYTVHTMADKEYNKYFCNYVKLLFNRFPTLFTPVAISNHVSKTIKKTYGNQLNTVIFNGSSELTVSSESETVSQYINQFKTDDDTLVFVYIGRIGREKNTMLLVQSFNELLQKNQNVILFIIGPDSSRKKDYLPQCLNANKYPNKIKFLGRKANIADYLLCADAVCLTSTYEGLGIAALEAFSMGVPVLSTPSGGPSDIIVSGINGYISEYTTVDSYVKVLNGFIEKPLRSREKIIELYKEKYTMSRCALKYLQLYNNRKIKIVRYL